MHDLFSHLDKTFYTKPSPDSYPNQSFTGLYSWSKLLSKFGKHMDDPERLALELLSEERTLQGKMLLEYKSELHQRDFMLRAIQGAPFTRMFKETERCLRTSCGTELSMG